jgi:hypothetical protein
MFPYEWRRVGGSVPENRNHPFGPVVEFNSGELLHVESVGFGRV